MKGFQRLHLKSAEGATVTFRVPQAELAVWNPRRQWAVEAGTFTAWVGGSSEASMTTHFELR